MNSMQDNTDKHNLPDVAGRIRKLRKELGLSLDELALRSFVSKSMISQIEAYKTNPTLTMVWKIARGLDISVQNLITGVDDGIKGDESSDEGHSEILFEYTNKENFTQLVADTQGVHFRVLTPLERSRDLEIYRITIQPGAANPSRAHLPGTEEYLTLLKGKLRVVAGENQSDLNTGDFIMYHADTEHSLINIGDEPVEIHLVVRFK